MSKCSCGITLDKYRDNTEQVHIFSISTPRWGMSPRIFLLRPNQLEKALDLIGAKELNKYYVESNCINEEERQFMSSMLNNNISHLRGELNNIISLKSVCNLNNVEDQLWETYQQDQTFKNMTRWLKHKAYMEIHYG